MPIYDTKRGPMTLTFTGTLAMRRYVRSLAAVIGIEGETPAIFKTSGAQFSAEFTWAPGITTKVSIVSGTGREEGWWAEAWSGLGAYASDDDRVVSADPPTDTEFDSSFSAGTYSISIDVEERLLIEGMDPADVATIDKTDFPTFGLLGGYAHGIPATRATTYFVARIGGVVSATISGGGATATASDVIGAAFPVSLAGIATMGCGSQDTPGWCRHLANWYGLAVTPEYARSIGGTVAAFVSANGSQWNAETNPTADNIAGASLTVLGQPPISASLDVQARRIGPDATVTNPSNITVGFQGQAGAATLLSGTGSFASSSEQRFYTCGSTLNTVTQTGITVDELAPLRAYVTQASLAAAGEDSRDWTLPFQLLSARLLDVTQNTETQVANSATLTANGSVSLTQTVWEGYRYLRVPYTLNNARTITLTHGDKSWSKALASGSGTWLIDLCAPHNLPVGFEVDERDWRWPLQNTATAPPINGLSLVDTLTDRAKGWLSGALKRPTTLGVSGLSAGDSLTISGLYLRREGEARVGVMVPFLSETLAWEGQSGGEQIDSTYIDPDLFLWSDSKLVGPWPFRARVDPVSSSTPNYFNYFTLSLLETYIEGAPGWVATQVAQPVGFPVLLADGTTPILGSASDAHVLGPYVHTGTTWRDQTYRQVTAELWGAACAHEFLPHPLTGDLRLAFNPTTNRAVPLRAATVLRGRAEGLAFGTDYAPLASADVVTAEHLPPNTVAGTAITGVRGEYRTNAPQQRGNIRHDTELRQGEAPYPLEDDYRAANRLPRRTSFLRAEQPPARALSIDVSRSGRLARAYLRGSAAPFDIHVGHAAWSAPTAWDDADTGLDGTYAAVAYQRLGELDPLWLLAIVSGSVRLYRRYENGLQTLMATLGSGDAGGHCWAPSGLLYAYRVSSGTAYLTRYRVDHAGALTVAQAEAATNLTGLDADASFDVASVVGPDLVQRISALHSVGGSLLVRLSADGVTFA